MKTTATATVKLTIKGVEHELTLDEARDVVSVLQSVLPKPIIYNKGLQRDFVTATGATPF